MFNYQDIFIANLKMFRKNKSLSQATLAELCDVSNGTIGNIECGLAKPSFDLIISIAKTLNIHPSYLFSTTTHIPQEYLIEHELLEKFYKSLKSHFS